MNTYGGTPPQAHRPATVRAGSPERSDWSRPGSIAIAVGIALVLAALLYTATSLDAGAGERVNQVSAERSHPDTQGDAP